MQQVAAQLNEAPPYRITPEILSLVERIGEALGRAEASGVAQDLQTLILTRWRDLFAHLPVESLVHARQSDYYAAIRESSAAGEESTPFILFTLEIIRLAVAEQT